MEGFENTNSFEEFMKIKRRLYFPNKTIKKFLKYAQGRYSKHNHVNWKFHEDINEKKKLVDEYVENSAELLILFCEFMELNSKSRLFFEYFDKVEGVLAQPEQSERSKKLAKV